MNLQLSAQNNDISSSRYKEKAYLPASIQSIHHSKQDYDPLFLALEKNIPILPSSYNEAHFKLYYGSLHTNEKILLIPANFPPPAIFFCFDFFHPPFVIVSHHLLFSFTNLEYNHPQPKSPPKPAQNYRHYTTEQDQAPFETGAPKPNRTR